MTLTSESVPHKLSNKQRVFVSEYLKCFNASEAARRAGYSEKTAGSIGQENLKKPEIKSIIDARIAEIQMGPEEAMTLLAEQARATVGVFFKIIEEWTFYPLPTYEIIDAKEVIDDTDPDNPVTRISYWVRHIAIDLDKVIDPRYSGLLQEFSDSSKTGITIKMYNKQTALEKILRVHGRFVERVENSGTVSLTFSADDMAAAKARADAAEKKLLEND